MTKWATIIKQSQIFSRVLGFIIYIVLGGAFGALLTGHVHVDGLGASLPMYFESMLIGATWSTYLSTVGFKVGQQKAQQNVDDRVEALKNEFANQLEELKKNLVPKVEKNIGSAETADALPRPIQAPIAAASVSSAIDDTNAVMQSQTDLTKQLIRKDFQRKY